MNIVTVRKLVHEYTDCVTLIVFNGAVRKHNIFETIVAVVGFKIYTCRNRQFNNRHGYLISIELRTGHFAGGHTSIGSATTAIGKDSVDNPQAAHTYH